MGPNTQGPDLSRSIKYFTQKTIERCGKVESFRDLYAKLNDCLNLRETVYSKMVEKNLEVY